MPAWVMNDNSYLSGKEPRQKDFRHDLLISSCMLSVIMSHLQFHNYTRQVTFTLLCIHQYTVYSIQYTSVTTLQCDLLLLLLLSHIACIAQMWPIATDVSRRMSVCALVTRTCHEKTAEPIEMPFGGWLPWAQGTTIKYGRDRPTGRNNFEGLSGPLKSNGISAAVYAAKGIIHSSITARHAMQHFVKILWPLVIIIIIMIINGNSATSLSFLFLCTFLLLKRLLLFPFPILPHFLPVGLSPLYF